MDAIEKLLGLYITSVFREGQRWAETQTLLVGLEILKGVRKVLKYQYLVFFSILLTTAGFFSLTVHGLDQFQSMNYLVFDNVYFIGILFLLIGSFGFYWSIQEERLLDAFGIPQIIAKLQNRQKVRQNVPTARPPAAPEVSKQEIEQIIRKVVAEEVQKASLAAERGKQTLTHAPKPVPQSNLYKEPKARRKSV